MINANISQYFTTTILIKHVFQNFIIFVSDKLQYTYNVTQEHTDVVQNKAKCCEYDIHHYYKIYYNLRYFYMFSFLVHKF